MPRTYQNEDTILSSMDIAQEILQCSKTLSQDYTWAALESAAPQVRRAFRQMARDSERTAFHAWEILHEHGHYQVKAAPQSECQQVEDMLESFQHGYAVPNAPGASSSRWGRGSSYGGAPDRSERERAERTELPEWARARV